jgi:hypothetical protein
VIQRGLKQAAKFGFKDSDTMIDEYLETFEEVMRRK